jgi:hypothetical protein
VPDFEITGGIREKIASRFGISLKQVSAIYAVHKKIVNGIKRQYLAHTIRAMEDSLRSLPGNEMFRIICSPVEGSKMSTGIASARYYKNRYFAIYYHPETDEKQLRVMLAHELGHLFLVDMFNARLDTDYDENTLIEPVSTVFGVFTILDKNDFYHNKTGPLKHRSIDDVLCDFTLLCNEDAGKHNVSS